MKRFAIALVVALAAAGARGDEKPRADEPNLKAGNLRFGANLSLEHDSFSNADTQTLFSGQVPVQYFFAGGLAIGGALDWSASWVNQQGISQSGGSVGLGPAITWYFWTQGRFAAYVEPELFFELRTDSLPTTIFVAGALGAQWFITPSVAFGPGIRYGHRYGSGVIADSDQYLFFLDLSVYL
jgi:hypothetical protein